MYTYIHTYIQVVPWLAKEIHTYIHTNIYTCIHTYIHTGCTVAGKRNTYIRTYIHKYIHTYIQVVPWLAKGIHDASKKAPGAQLNLNRFMSDMIMSR